MRTSARGTSSLQLEGDNGLYGMRGARVFTASFLTEPAGRVVNRITN